MKLGIVYWTSGGNTEDLANKAKEVGEGKGLDVYFSDLDNLEKDAFFGCDVLAFGCPAQGSEELSPEMQDLMNSISDEISGKKVFMFGSFGWGDGEYMEEWKNMMNDKGAEIAHEPVVCLETPDNEAFSNIEEAVNSLV